MRSELTQKMIDRLRMDQKRIDEELSSDKALIARKTEGLTFLQHKRDALCTVIFHLEMTNDSTGEKI